MNRINNCAVALFLTVIVLFSSRAQAMPIWQFDKMAVSDQSEYVGLLIKGAKQVLRDGGHPDQAAEVEHLFTTTSPGDAHTIGMLEFETNLAVVRATDADNVLRNPGVKRFHVEHALKLTLHKNGIELPSSFFAVASDFKPKHSAQAGGKPE